MACRSLHHVADLGAVLDLAADGRAVIVEWARERFDAATSDADEQAAIDSGLIQANRIQYVGRRPSRCR